MSWMTRLIETYDVCNGNKDVPESEGLLPIAHTSQLAQIEIVLDGKGNFRSAKVLDKPDRITIMPCTEESAGRTSGPVAHPLCDKLKYVAGDFSERVFDAAKTHQKYLDVLEAWTKHSKHPKLTAILKYVQKGQVIADLVEAKVLFAGRNGKLLDKWTGTNDTPEIFKAILSGNQAEALVRWRVEHGKGFASGTWEDQSLISAWTKYYASLDCVSGLCMITGEQVSLAKQHPKKVRHSADNAKLVSSNDKDGYTYRGRFVKSEEALAIGFVETQKSHSALRWLIDRQSFKNEDQVIVSWATSGNEIPDLYSDSSIFGTEKEDGDEATDVGQAFARRLAKAIAGYKSNLSDKENIIVMALDSAGPGRLAIAYYRELSGSEYLDRLERWYLQYSWMQNFGKERHFVGTPAPRDIAEAAYGKRLDNKLKKATVERLLPCIIDGVVVPQDLIKSISHRVSNRSGLEYWEFEKYLGIVCALYRGVCYQRKEYKMTLEEGLNSRDYLFGRLLAVAERMEGQVIFRETKPGQKPREPTASRLFQRFSDRPASTWLTIESALKPYRAKTNSSKFEKLLDEITGLFSHDDFISDRKLSPEFLLGYRCQREMLWARKEPEKSEGDAEAEEN